MRNLKKVMALALATVMLLGIMVMGAGAADYTAYKDAASVDAKYELAVEMLKELGIFEGDNNGNLNAKNTLTRGEAAKVIATVKLGKDTASKIGAPIAAPFADVATSDWYAPFVAYCKDLGIISGVGDNKFDPNGTLTGYAFAKMLLVAVGYNAEKEGFTGAAWDTNVNLKAYTLKLLDNLSLNLGDAITREQAIQMAYNAMTKPEVVNFKNAGFNITTPDGFQMSSNGGEYEKVAANLLQYLNGVDTYKQGKGTDKIGLTTNKWAKKDANGAYTITVAEATAAKVVLTYTGKVSDLTFKKVYADAGLTAATPVTVYVNTITGGTAESLNKDNTGLVAKDYNGATVKLIVNDGAYVILIEMPTLGTVGAYATAKDGVKAHFPITGTELKIFTDDSKAYAEKDLVLYTLGTDGKVLTHKKAAIEAGKIAEITKAGEVVLNGTTYPFAGSAVGADKSYAADALEKQKNVAFVVENGYIYASTTPATVTTKASLEGVYFVAGFTAPVTDAWGAEVYYAQVVALSDGVISLEKVEAADVKDTNKNGLFTLADADKDGLKELVIFDGWEKEGDVKTKQTIFMAGLKDTSIKTTTKAIETTDGKAYFTANSTILTITGAKDALAAGFKTAPADIDAAAASSKIENITVIYTENKDKVKEVALVIFKSEKALVANTVITSAAYYVVPGSNGSVYNADAKAVYEKMNIIDLKTLEAKEVLVAKAVAGYADGTVNKYGAYEFTAKTPTTSAVVAKDAKVSLYNNMLTVDGLTINGEAVTDYDVTNVKVLNPSKVLDKNDKNAITTVAEMLAAKCEFAIDTNKTTDTVNYIIVISK